MTSTGAEALKAALRRSLPLIIGLVVLGIVAVNVFKLIQGDRYEANAKVLISTTPLSNIITGTEPSFVDPERVQQTALGIADSPEVYELAATQTSDEFGNRDDLQADTEVTADPDSDLISFAATTSDADRSVGMANAVATAYIDFRARLSRSQIRNTIERLESRLSAFSAGSAEREALEEQLSTLEVLENANVSDAELVAQATSADKVSPALLTDSLVGFSIGLVVALLVVALREAIDTRVRSESDVEDLLSAPVLATVGPLPRGTRIVTYGRYEAMFSDTYALLAAQLARRRTAEGGIVLAVTSAGAQEGKTATAANLAVSIARRGENVLLADFDFRKPAVSDVFELPVNAEGALQVLSGRTSLESTLWSVSLEGPRPVVSRNGSEPADVPTEDELREREGQAIGSLQILPSGGVASTRKVPQQSRLGLLLRGLRSRVDVVILDTPPALLTVEVAELSRLIDMVLVVVRQGRASQRNLRTLRRQARTWDAEVAGAVMTDVRTEAARSYYHAGR
jgi:polysaccharide biosynthesis transport protein